MKDKKIAVLLGGPSEEAEVSRRTGAAIAEALQGLGYEAEPLELDPSGLLTQLKDARYEVVFNAIHGKFGEDGSLSGLLEMAGIPYTGSGVMAHAVGMNKKISKAIFVASGIPTPKSKSYDLAHEDHNEVAKEIREQFSVPVVLKAANQGSSIGVIIVKDEEELAKSVEEISRIDSVMIVEEFIEGREFTVSVLNGKALPVIEIRPHSGEYDYASKYTANATDYLVPAPLDDIERQEMQRIGELVFKELQCAGVIRVDIMMDGTGRMFVLEYNTTPGMTATSLVPKAANATGMDFPTLCETILLSAGLGKL